MYIQEAVKEALKSDGYIARTEWKRQLRLKPTNTDNCCIIENKTDPPARGWQPSAEDLIANDWGVVKEKRKDVSEGLMPEVDHARAAEIRKSSRQARWISIVALIISVAALIMRILM